MIAPDRCQRQRGEKHRVRRRAQRLARDRALLKHGRQRDDKEAAQRCDHHRLAPPSHRHHQSEREQDQRRRVERRAQAARIDLVALAVPRVRSQERPGLLADEPRFP
jgi:hypothetical protein